MNGKCYIPNYLHLLVHVVEGKKQLPIDAQAISYYINMVSPGDLFVEDAFISTLKQVYCFKVLYM